MEMCLEPNDLMMFLNMLDASIVDIVSKIEVVVNATVGPISWQYLPEVDHFCIDGVITEELIEKLANRGDPA